MLDKKIIRVESVEQSFLITWTVGARCNYDCMYCPSDLHDSTSPHKSLDALKNNWLSILEQSKSKNLKYKISFSGGEVTGNKDFIPMLAWLRQEYNELIDKIILSTNGSASYKYYKRLLELVDNISFSVHSEFIDEQKFFDTVLKLSKGLSKDKHIHVNIMDEFWNQDRIKLYQEILSKYKVSHSVNEINYAMQTRTIPILKGKYNLAIT